MWIGWVNSQIGLPVMDADTNMGANKDWTGLGGHRLAGGCNIRYTRPMGLVVPVVKKFQ